MPDERGPQFPIPLHAAVMDADGRPLRIVRRPGRPRRAKPAPDGNELEFIARTNELRDEHIQGDDLVRALEDGSTSGQVIDIAVQALARESAALSWDVRHAREHGGPIEQLLSRRIDGLHKIASILLSRRRAGLESELADSDPRMAKVKTFFIQNVGEVAEATLSPGQAAEFMRRLRYELERASGDEAEQTPRELAEGQ